MTSGILIRGTGLEKIQSGSSEAATITFYEDRNRRFTTREKIFRLAGTLDTKYTPGLNTKREGSYFKSCTAKRRKEKLGKRALHALVALT